jgi:hypothetical protein
MWRDTGLRYTPNYFSAGKTGFFLPFPKAFA